MIAYIGRILCAWLLLQAASKLVKDSQELLGATATTKTLPEEGVIEEPPTEKETTPDPGVFVPSPPVAKWFHRVLLPTELHGAETIDGEVVD